MINTTSKMGINDVPYLTKNDKMGDIWESGTLANKTIGTITYYSPTVTIIKGNLVKEDATYLYYEGFQKKSFRLRVAVATPVFTNMFSSGVNIPIPTLSDLGLTFPFNGTWINTGIDFPMIDIYTMGYNTLIARNDIPYVFRLLSFVSIPASETDRFVVNTIYNGLIRINK